MTTPAAWHCLLRANDTGDVDDVFALVTLDKKTAAYFLSLRNHWKLVKSTVSSLYRLEIWFQPDELYSYGYIWEWDEDIAECAEDMMQVLSEAHKPPPQKKSPRGDAFVARVSDTGVSFRWNPKHDGRHYFWTNEISWATIEDAYNGTMGTSERLFIPGGTDEHQAQ